MAIPLPANPALHPLFEMLAYALGYAAYRRMRNATKDVVTDQQRWTILAAASIGALIGSRMLGLLEQVPRLHEVTWRTLLLPGGKTIVGGLLGGWIAVELIKWLSGIHSRTGDLYAIPLCLGIAIGRVGCLLAGLADNTYGKPTSLPWAVDFGDGIGRHPTQLYEILFLLSLGSLLARFRQRPDRQGSLFRIFLAAYLAFRLVVDFLKPQPLVLGMNLIQWTCLLGLCALAIGLWFDSRRHGTSTVSEAGMQRLPTMFQ